MQDGSQKWWGNMFFFGKKVAHDPAYIMPVENFVEIAVSCTVSEINTILCFTYTFKMAAKNGVKPFFAKTPRIKSFIKIALSHTVSKQMRF